MRLRGVYEKVPGSGEWWVRHADSQGRLRREKAGTKSAALALYRKRKTQALEGRKLPEKLRRPPVTFAELSVDTLAYSKAHKRTHSDDVRLMARINDWFGTRPAESITPQDIERRFEDGIRDHGWAPSTVNHHRSLISLTYRLGIRNGKVSINPARATKHRKEDNSRTRSLTADEESRLRAAILAKCPHHLYELDLALHTGLRKSEMFGLKWQDVDIARKLLLIRRGKNGEARYVNLNPVAVKALTALQTDPEDPAAPVFISHRSSEALQGARHWFKKALATARIKNFRWHDLRHTFASRLAMTGSGVRTLQEALGHKSPSMAMRYTHLTSDFLQDAVDRLAPQAEDPKGTDTPTSTSGSTVVVGKERRLQ